MQPRKLSHCVYFSLGVVSTIFFMSIEYVPEETKGEPSYTVSISTKRILSTVPKNFLKTHSSSGSSDHKPDEAENYPVEISGDRGEMINHVVPVPIDVKNVQDTRREIMESQEAIDTSQVLSPSPKYVLLLSSLPRSGSTLLSEVLGKIQNSVVFFEPLWIQENKPCINDEFCIENYIQDIYRCNYTDSFENWLRGKKLFASYFNAEAAACTHLPAKIQSSCLKRLNLREKCLNSSVRIIKVIRARMHWFERMLKNTAIDFKIIHITRDPRGSLNSISKFNWDHDPFRRCSGLDKDIETYDHYKEKYPGKVLNIAYEKFCLSPNEETAKIFSFLYGTAAVPEPVTSYLSVHMSAKKGKGAMNTYKDSQQEYEAWRWKIKEDLLLKTEREPTCRSAIKKMKYYLFGTLENTRNKTLPLFSPETLS